MTSHSRHCKLCRALSCQVNIERLTLRDSVVHIEIGPNVIATSTHTPESVSKFASEDMSHTRSGQKQIPECFLGNQIPAKKRVLQNFSWGVFCNVSPQT